MGAVVVRSKCRITIDGELVKTKAKLKLENEQLREALQGLLDIGKRDMSNPKYDGYFEAAREALDNDPRVNASPWIMDGGYEEFTEYIITILISVICIILIVGLAYIWRRLTQ